MQITYTPTARAHLDYWQKTGNKPILKRIFQLTKAVIDNPYEGIGKPEPLKYELSGYWPRRINNQHRFIYLVVDGILFIQSLKGHY